MLSKTAKIELDLIYLFYPNVIPRKYRESKNACLVKFI